MITEEERQSIINEAVEKALLMLPEVVGNLIMNQINLLKINRTFYEKYPDLASSKDLVAAVVEQVEGERPGLSYESILSQAVPRIREQIRSITKLDMKTVHRPNRNLAALNLDGDQQ